MSDATFKRISVMIREDQHEKLLELGINVSGQLRDLIDDFLSENTITLSVSPETMEIYHQVFTGTGATDAELEPLVVRALRDLLATRISRMQNLQKRLEKGELRDER
ncbi:MAG: hypothetical protein KDD39_09895 [Bdellovibrionales bacterium]|nr:hypothetical protein [Bdellovibrionales bacterium]